MASPLNRLEFYKNCCGGTLRPSRLRSGVDAGLRNALSMEADCASAGAVGGLARWYSITGCGTAPSGSLNWNRSRGELPRHGIARSDFSSRISSRNSLISCCNCCTLGWLPSGRSICANALGVMRRQSSTAKQPTDICIRNIMSLLNYKAQSDRKSVEETLRSCKFSSPGRLKSIADPRLALDVLLPLAALNFLSQSGDQDAQVFGLIVASRPPNCS